MSVNYIKKYSSIISLAIIVILSKFSQLFLDFIISNTLGDGYITDSIIICLSITTGLSNFYFIQTNRNLIGFTAGLTIENQTKIITKLITFNLIIFSPLVILATVYSSEILNYLFNDMSLATFRMSKYLLSFFLVSVLSNLIFHSLNVLKLNDNISNLLPITNIINVFISISFLILYSYYSNNIFIGYAFLLGPIFQVLIFIYYSWKRIKIITFKIIDFFNFYEIRKIILSTLPILIIHFISEFSKVYEKSTANSIGEGVVSAYYYSNKLNISLIGILITVFSFKVLPTLSKLFKTDKVKFISLSKKTIFFSILIVLFFTFFLVLTSDLLIDNTLNYSKKIENIVLLKNSFIIYSFGAISYLIIQIISMIFISSNKFWLAYLPLLIVSFLKFSSLFYINKIDTLNPHTIPLIHLISFSIAGVFSLFLMSNFLKKIQIS